MSRTSSPPPPSLSQVPDYALIAEIRLYSFGYTDARRLSKKMVKTFQLASEQVFRQYDKGQPRTREASVRPHSLGQPRPLFC